MCSLWTRLASQDQGLSHLEGRRGLWKNLVALPYLLGTAEHHRKGHAGSGPSIPARDSRHYIGRQDLPHSWLTSRSGKAESFQQLDLCCAGTTRQVGKLEGLLQPEMPTVGTRDPLMPLPSHTARENVFMCTFLYLEYQLVHPRLTHSAASWSVVECPLTGTLQLQPGTSHLQ